MAKKSFEQQQAERDAAFKKKSADLAAKHARERDQMLARAANDRVRSLLSDKLFADALPHAREVVSLLELLAGPKSPEELQREFMKASGLPVETNGQQLAQNTQTRAGK